jgi:hypothetical protein
MNSKNKSHVNYIGRVTFIPVTPSFNDAYYTILLIERMRMVPGAKIS